MDSRDLSIIQGFRSICLGIGLASRYIHVAAVARCKLPEQRRSVEKTRWCAKEEHSAMFMLQA